MKVRAQLYEPEDGGEKRILIWAKVGRRWLVAGNVAYAECAEATR